MRRRFIFDEEGDTEENSGSVYDFEDDQDRESEEGDSPGEERSLLSRVSDTIFSGAMFERRAAARQILEAFKQVYESDDILENVLVLIDKLVRDEEQTVRAVVMEQIPDIGIYCHEVGPHLDFVVSNHVLPYIVHLLCDTFAQVRKAAQNGLLLLVERGVVTPNEVEQHIFPVLMPYTESRAQDDVRGEVAGFLSKLAQVVGKDIVVGKYLKRFCLLCDDPSSQVRRICATSMEDMFSVVGPCLSEKALLPRFLSLCEDEVWGVRRACAEVFPSVSSASTLQVRKKHLAKTFISLLEDSSAWVRIAAFKTLGPFISTYHVPEGSIPPINAEPTESEKEFLAELTKLNRSFLRSSSKESSTARGSVQDYYMRRSSGNRPFSFDEEIFSDEDDSNEFMDSSFIEFNELEETPMDCTEDEEGESKLMYKDSESGISVEERKSEACKIIVSSPSEDSKDGDSQPASQEICESQTQSELPAKEEEAIGNILTSSDEKGISSSLISQVYSTPEKSIVIHLEKGKSSHSNPMENTFNTFQYWRVPLPDIQLDINMSNGQPTNIFVRAKIADPNQNITFASELNVNLSKSDVLGGDSNKLRDDQGDQINENSTNAEEITIHTMSQTKVSSSGDGYNLVQSSGDHVVANKNDSAGETVLESTDSVTKVSVVGGVVADVHRSYYNLFTVSNFDQKVPKPNYPEKQQMETYASKLFYSNDTTFNMSPEDLPYIVKAHGPRGDQGHLLPLITKTYTVESQDVIPPQLLAYYIKMSSSQHDGCESAMDSELPSYCSFNFPAVVVTLGPENWSIIRECFELLACQCQWKIRYTLASCLHEIAQILGPELSERDLIPFYYAMTKDLDEVRVGMLSNLANFIKVLGKQARSNILDSLGTFLVTDNKNNWRFRLELATQLVSISDLVEPEDVFKHLCPLALDLSLDSIADVRRGALLLMAHQVLRLNSSSSDTKTSLVKDFLLKLVEVLGQNTKWVQRQCFATLAGHLLEKKALKPVEFAEFILPQLVELSDDKVPNVRIVLAQIISAYLIDSEYFANPSNPHNEILMETIRKLKCDIDKDVKFYIGIDAAEPQEKTSTELENQKD